MIETKTAFNPAALGYKGPDFSKPLQTRDGNAARVLCTDLKTASNKWPILVAVTDKVNGLEHTYQVSIWGTVCVNTSETEGTTPNPFHQSDIINVPKRYKARVYMVFYKDGSRGCSCVPPTFTVGQAAAVKVIDVDLAEGEGLGA